MLGLNFHAYHILQESYFNFVLLIILQCMLITQAPCLWFHYKDIDHIVSPVIKLAFMLYHHPLLPLGHLLLKIIIIIIMAGTYIIANYNFNFNLLSFVTIST